MKKPYPCSLKSVDTAFFVSCVSVRSGPFHLDAAPCDFFLMIAVLFTGQKGLQFYGMQIGQSRLVILFGGKQVFAVFVIA